VIKGRMPWHQANLQTLFQETRSRQYFAVALEGQFHQSVILLHANAPENAPDSTRNR
jgi:hypothetical protein